MKPVLNFLDYCEIASGLRRIETEKFNFCEADKLNGKKPIEWNENMLRAKAMFIADPDNADIILLWLEQCNLQMVKDLMDYFEEDAPIQKMLFQRYEALEKESCAGRKEIELEEQNLGWTVYDYLVEQMQKKGYTTDADFYHYIGMDRRSFAKLRKKDAHVTREMALWLAAGFEFNLLETQKFLKDLGYALRKNVRRENLIAQVMRTRKYRFMDMQEILYYFGEKPFGEA